MKHVISLRENTLQKLHNDGAQLRRLWIFSLVDGDWSSFRNVDFFKLRYIFYATWQVHELNNSKRKLIDQLSDYQFLSVPFYFLKTELAKQKILRNSAKKTIRRTAAVQQDACIFVSQ